VAGERDDLYSEGMAAYSNKDHVESLKKLFAFYVLNEDEIKKNPEFEIKLKNLILTSEAILKLSFAINSSIQQGDGHIKFINNNKYGGSSFSGTGAQVIDSLKKNETGLKAKQELNHKALTMPSVDTAH
jgi:hypothetical protein